MKLMISDLNGYLVKEVKDWTGVVPQIGDNLVDDEDYVLKVCGRCVNLEHADIVHLFVDVTPTKKNGNDIEHGN